MEYNKQQFTKSLDRKKLHKIKKRWVVVSTAMLLALGGGAVVTHASVHADANNNGNSKLNSVKQGSAASQSSRLTTKSGDAQSASSNAASTSQTSSISQQAKALHNHILMNNLHQSSASVGSKQSQSSASASQSHASSAASSSSVSSSAAAKTMTIKPVKLSSDNSKPGAVIVKYFNHGKEIGNPYTITGPNNSTISDITKVSDINNQKDHTSNLPGSDVNQKYTIPKGYQINPGLDKTYKLTPGMTAEADLNLVGDEVTSDNENGRNQVTVIVTKNDNQGHSINVTRTKMITGRVGDTVYISPHDYIPSDYYPDSADQEATATIQPNGSLIINSGNSHNVKAINFIYDENGMHQNDYSTLRFHYVDYSNPAGGDIVNSDGTSSMLHDLGTAGQPITSDYLKGWERMSPVNYYAIHKIMAGTKVPKAFGTQDQSITFLVAKDDDVKYVDQSDQQVVKQIDLTPDNTNNGKISGQISYQPYSTSPNLPNGYKIDGQPQWNSNFKSGGVNIIPVRRVDGKIDINYLDEDNNDKNVGSLTVLGKPNSAFNINNYNGKDYNNNSAIPTSGYHIDKVLNYVNNFNQGVQTVNIGVKSNAKPKPKPSKPKTINVTIIYKDVATQKQVGNSSDVHKVSGTVGTSLQSDYAAYSAGNMIPKGYQFDHVDQSNDKSFEDGENGDPETIWVHKAKTPSDVDGSITFTYLYNNKQIGSDYKDTQKVGSSIDPTAVAKAHNPDPKDYDFDHLITGNLDRQFTTQNQDVLVALKPKSNSPQQTKGTINIYFHDNDNDKTYGPRPVTSDIGHTFSINNYENATYGMPANTHVVSVTPDVNSFTNSPQNVYVNVADDKGQINIDFMYNGQQEGHHTATSDVGHAFNIDNYEKASDGMPSGYSVASVTPNIPVFTNNLQTETVNLKKNAQPTQSDGTVDVHFILNGNDVKDYAAKGKLGTNFNVANYENTADGMPSDATITNVSTNNVSEFTKQLQNVDVYMKKNSQPQPKPQQSDGSITVHFILDHADVHDYTAKSKVGTSFDVTNYENGADGMPSDAKIIGVSPSNVTQFTSKPQNVDVYMQKNTQPQSDGSIMIHFMYDNTQKAYYNAIAPIGSSFNISDYESPAYNMPSDYQVTGVTNNVTKYTKQPQDVYVNLAKRQGTINIHFMHDNQQLNSYQAIENIGDSFNINDYENSSHNMPSGYKVSSVSYGDENNVTEFTKQPQDVYVNLTANPVNPNQPTAQGTISVYFKNNGNVVSGPHSVNGNVGDPFNIGDYENVADGMPANTHVTNVENNVTAFTQNPQDVYVDVANNSNPTPTPQPQPTPKPTPQPTNAKGTINIYFNDANNTYGPYTVTGKAGDPFNIANYENTADGMPANTHVTDVFNNTNKFPSGNQDIFVNVASNNPVNPTPHSNTPSSSNNPSSNTPASNSVPSSSNTPSSNPASNNTPSSSNAPSSSNTPSDNTPSDNTPSSSDTTPSDSNGGGNHYSNHHSNQSTPSNSGNNNDYGGNSGNGNNNQNYSNNPSQDNNSGNSLRNRIIGNNSRNTSRRLAQTGEASIHNRQIAEILVTLGMALSALGYAIDRKRRDY